MLVGLALPAQSRFAVEEHLDELAELASSAGAEVVGRVIQQRPTPDPATYIGRGKAETIAEEARALGATGFVFDDDLSGSQTKNLEDVLKLPVEDRSSLILRIFDQRARSREARTQVELARLKYMLPRLTRQWGHLSRQQGGVGVRGGEGETQLEADRRVLRQKISRLERDLVKIERTRATQRRGRHGVPTVALAGYTNAGKSTLFNALTSAGTLTENRLFATLDSKLRRGRLGEGQSAVFADTVGFIRKLPHHLVASFRSTLEESALADVVLHVIDRSHPQWQEQMEVADAVLLELGVDPNKVVRVFNKRDLLPPGEIGQGGGIWVSAVSGEGLQALREEVIRRLDPLAMTAAERRFLETPEELPEMQEMPDAEEESVPQPS